MSWTQPVCERCWFELEGDWTAEFVLASVRMPVRLSEPEVEQCAWCGHPTIFGAYRRVDPATVPYPRVEREP